MHAKGIVDVCEMQSTLEHWRETWTSIHEFHFCVLRARTHAVFSQLGLTEAQQRRVLHILAWDKVHLVGVQAYALALPQVGEDYYDPGFIVRMVRTTRRVVRGLWRLRAGHDNWEDGWYQRFPAALPPLQG